MREEERPARPTPLATQVEQLLTEARLIIPGAQALLGFQLTVTLMRTFEQLPVQAKLVHAAALVCVAVAVILLMAPASLHRIGFAGQDDPAFVTIASGLVIAAPAPLAAGRFGVPCATRMPPKPLHRLRIPRNLRYHSPQVRVEARWRWSRIG